MKKNSKNGNMYVFSLLIGAIGLIIFGIIGFFTRNSLVDIIEVIFGIFILTGYILKKLKSNKWFIYVPYSIGIYLVELFEAKPRPAYILNKSL